MVLLLDKHQEMIQKFSYIHKEYLRILFVEETISLFFVRVLFLMESQ